MKIYTFLMKPDEEMLHAINFINGDLIDGE